MRQLRTQLKYLPCLLQPKANINIKECFKAILEQATSEKVKLICEVIALANILLLAPTSNAESERVFSSLKRLKTYLRSTMNQQRLARMLLTKLTFWTEKLLETTLLDLHRHGAAIILDNFSIYCNVDVRILVILSCYTHTIRYDELHK